MKVILGILTLLFLSYSAFSQQARRRILKKDEFVHTWLLFQMRSRTNDLITDKVERKILRFTADSVFILTKDKSYSGKWTFEKGQIQILIPDCSECNYKWTIMGDNTICFRIDEDMSQLECFKKEE